ncbi:MAG: hypothetical protein JRI91_04155 [Deltaproteobacteria bacterium]|nr:hypothetical protein [Deltaproteobacteria bacterium]
MSDNNGPEKKIKDSSLPEDEEIIDLTEVVQDTSAGDEEIIDLIDTVAEDNDDVIELTDVVTDETSEEEILDLTDVVEDDEIIDLTDAVEDDEDVIELTDVEETAPVPGEMPDGVEPIALEDVVDVAGVAGAADVPEDKSDESDVQLEDTIELDAQEKAAPAMEPVMEPDVESEEEPEALEPETPETETIDESDEDIDKELLELIESINDDDFAGSKIEDIGVDEDNDVQIDEDLLEPDEEIEASGDDLEEQNIEEGKVFAESLDEDLGSALTFSEDDAESKKDGEKILDRPGVVSVKVQDLREEGRPVDFKFESKLQPGDKLFREKDYNRAITQAATEQVEEAVRKVIKEMLADKIDGLITDVIEKKVLQEIDRMKNLLVSDTENDK